jgi:hypothetical protein
VSSETLIVDGALHELGAGGAPETAAAAAAAVAAVAAEAAGTGAGAGAAAAAAAAAGGPTAAARPDPSESQEHHGNQEARAQHAGASSPTTKCLTALAPASFRLPPGPLRLPPPPRDHQHLLHFRLRELSLLMGTDVQVFRNARHPAGVSALFYEESEGLELSHCLDSYLENVRARLHACMRV